MEIYSRGLDFTKDYPAVLGWVSERWEAPEDSSNSTLDPNILPRLGTTTFLGDTIAVVSFLYNVQDSEMSLMAFLSSNPNLSPQNSYKAINRNIEDSVKLSESLGNTCHVSLLEHPGLIKLMKKKQGFTSGQSGMQMLYKGFTTQEALMD